MTITIRRAWRIQPNSGKTDWDKYEMLIDFNYDIDECYLSVFDYTYARCQQFLKEEIEVWNPTVLRFQRKT